MGRQLAWGTIYERVVMRAGFPNAQVLGEDRAALIAAIDEAVAYGWEYAMWPDLLEVVAVEPRLATDATQGPIYADATSDELESGRGWYLDGGDYDEGTLERVTTKHPQRSAGWPGTVTTKRLGGRLMLRDFDQSVGADVYVEQRQAVPDLNAVLFSESDTYAVGDVVIYPGSDPVVSPAEVYRCAVATSAGEHPVNTPASWTVQAVPGFLSQFVVEAASALWHEADGALEKEAIKERVAEKFLEGQLMMLQNR